MVLEAGSIAEIDFTAAQTLVRIAGYCRERGIAFAIARLQSLRAQHALAAFGVLKELGENRVFLSVDDATRAITGPSQIFEGNKGFKEAISGTFTIHWPNEDLERVNRTIVKKYNAEIHAQSAIEGVLDLRRQYNFKGKDVAQVHIAIFDVAYHIIGGGEEGDKKIVLTKGQADHSLPYTPRFTTAGCYRPNMRRRASRQAMFRICCAG